MQHKYIGIIAVLGIIISGCAQIEAPDTRICEELAIKLDERIVDTNNPPGRFIIDGYEGVVGGTLIEISEPSYYALYDENQGIVTYHMTFKGINKKGSLPLRTSSDTLRYEIGEFYKFDLENINQYSMQLSGAFLDPNQDALERMDCD